MPGPLGLVPGQKNKICNYKKKQFENVYCLYTKSYIYIYVYIYMYFIDSGVSIVIMLVITHASQHILCATQLITGLSISKYLVKFFGLIIK